MDGNLLDAYFAGSQINSVDLETIHKYRQCSIDIALQEGDCKFDVKFMQDIRMFQEKYSDLLEDKLYGQNVIELGPGMEPSYEELLPFHISGYTAVEPFATRATGGAMNFMLERIGDDHYQMMDLSDKDGLSYLIGQPDNSAVVISFGMMCEELMPFTNQVYYQFLAKEIYRVTPEGSISIHVGNPGTDLVKIFNRVGFDAEPFLSSEWTIMAIKR